MISQSCKKITCQKSIEMFCYSTIINSRKTWSILSAIGTSCRHVSCRFLFTQSQIIYNKSLSSKFWPRPDAAQSERQNTCSCRCIRYFSLRICHHWASSKFASSATPTMPNVWLNYHSWYNEMAHSCRIWEGHDSFENLRHHPTWKLKMIQAVNSSKSRPIPGRYHFSSHTPQFEDFTLADSRDPTDITSERCETEQDKVRISLKFIDTGPGRTQNVILYTYSNHLENFQHISFQFAVQQFLAQTNNILLCPTNHNTFQQSQNATHTLACISTSSPVRHYKHSLPLICSAETSPALIRITYSCDPHTITPNCNVYHTSSSTAPLFSSRPTWLQRPHQKANTGNDNIIEN